MSINIKFEPKDIWIGIYWTTHNWVYEKELDLYICIIPMLPIKIAIKKSKP
jgi:hypothetical protein